MNSASSSGSRGCNGRGTRRRAPCTDRRECLHQRERARPALLRHRAATCCRVHDARVGVAPRHADGGRPYHVGRSCRDVRGDKSRADRESPDSRLPDVASPAVILAAWITGIALRASQVGARRSWSRDVARQRSEPPGLPFYGSPRSSDRLASVSKRPAYSPDRGPRSTASTTCCHAAASTDRVLRPADSAGIPALTRYVQQCTRPSDRLLVAWFEPQIFFYAERPFGGPDLSRPTVAFVDRRSDPDGQPSPSAARAHRPGQCGEGERIPRGFTLVHQASRRTTSKRRGRGLARPCVCGVVRRDGRPKRTCEPLNLPCYR